MNFKDKNLNQIEQEYLACRDELVARGVKAPERIDLEKMQLEYERRHAYLQHEIKMHEIEQRHKFLSFFILKIFKLIALLGVIGLLFKFVGIIVFYAKLKAAHSIYGESVVGVIKDI